MRRSASAPAGSCPPVPSKIKPIVATGVATRRAKKPSAAAIASARARAFAKVIEPHAPATRRAYANAWDRWLAHCEGAGIESTPITPPDLVTHLDELLARLAPSTVMQALGALCSLDRTMQLAVDADAMPGSLWRHPIVDRWRTATKRATAEAKQDQAPALERGDMLAIIRAISHGEAPPGRNPEAIRRAALRDRAVLLVGWLGCLRRGELAALDLDDVKISDRGIEITLWKSKGDQEGEGAIVAIHRQGAPELCAARAWEQWTAERRLAQVELADDGAPAELPPADVGPAFVRVHQAGEWGDRLSGHAIHYVIKRRAEAAGLAAKGHSLRAGFATEAALQGRQQSDIKAHGRWKSDQVVEGYVRRGEAWRGNPTDGLS